MTPLLAALLGVIQGLTEFLPISSTAHLTIFGKLFGLVSEESSEGWTAFLAVIQLGTLIAVVFYFYHDLLRMAICVIADLRRLGTQTRFMNLSSDTKLAVLIMSGTIPVGIVGLLFSDAIHGVLTKNLLVISSSLITLAFFLWVAEKQAKHVRDVSQITLRDAMLIGVAQCLALIPGSSRSGTTITAGLFLNLTRSSAARFSFLLSIPAVFASGMHEMLSLEVDPFQFGIASVVIATIASAVSGYVAIAWLLRYLMRQSTMIFVVYRISLGFLLFGLVASGILRP